MDSMKDILRVDVRPSVARGFAVLVVLMSVLKSVRSRQGFGSRRGEQGYSLLEVLIVLAIIALIATFVGPRLFAQLDRSKATAARIQIQSFMSALETVRLDLGRYPTQAEGLTLLVGAPNGDEAEQGAWRGPYIDASVPLDPWGGAYIYTAAPGPDERPNIISYGADRKAGGTGAALDIAATPAG
jgi:general secretion pathway protein G